MRRRIWGQQHGVERNQIRQPKHAMPITIHCLFSCLVSFCFLCLSLHPLFSMACSSVTSSLTVLCLCSLPISPFTPFFYFHLHLPVFPSCFALLPSVTSQTESIRMRIVSLVLCMHFSFSLLSFCSFTVINSVLPLHPSSFLSLQ